MLTKIVLFQKETCSLHCYSVRRKVIRLQKCGENITKITPLRVTLHKKRNITTTSVALISMIT